MEMIMSFANPVAQIARLAVLAALLLSLSAAILRADESRTFKAGEAGIMHCRMYFGCAPDLAKVRAPLN
jgi:hypothetical protein